MTIFSYQANTLGDEMRFRSAVEEAGLIIDDWEDDDDWDDDWGDEDYDDVDHQSYEQVHELLTVELFCLSRRPGGGARCQRIRSHDGDHNAYTWHISSPETWGDT